MVEKRRKMQKLLADYPLVVNEEDPKYISSSLWKFRNGTKSEVDELLRIEKSENPARIVYCFGISHEHPDRSFGPRTGRRGGEYRNGGDRHHPSGAPRPYDY